MCTQCVWRGESESDRNRVGKKMWYWRCSRQRQYSLPPSFSFSLSLFLLSIAMCVNARMFVIVTSSININDLKSLCYNKNGKYNCNAKQPTTAAAAVAATVLVIESKSKEKCFWQTNKCIKWIVCAAKQLMLPKRHDDKNGKKESSSQWHYIGRLSAQHSTTRTHKPTRYDV